MPSLVKWLCIILTVAVDTYTPEFHCYFCLQKPQHHLLSMRTPQSWWSLLRWIARRANATDSCWFAPSGQKRSSPRWKRHWMFLSTMRTIMRRTWMERTQQILLSASIGRWWEDSNCSHQSDRHSVGWFYLHLTLGFKFSISFFQGGSFGNLFVFDRDLTPIFPIDQSHNRYDGTLLNSDQWIKNTFDIKDTFSEKKAARGGIRETVHNYSK